MPTRDRAPIGSPCWTDLWTSDVAQARSFYAHLFGWVAEEPSPEFGGYFLFTRHGVPVAGAMGAMGDTPADDSWKVYLDTDDLAKTLQVAESEGGQVTAPAMAVADLGSQGMLVDATGAPLGAWQPETFPGFTVLGEHGTPSWFELHARDYAAAVAFYRSVFAWDVTVVSDTEEFRYATMRDPDGGEDLAGILDAGAALGDGEAARWLTYWQVDDVDASVATLVDLGGAVLTAAQDTPYGRIAGVADPAGARFMLRGAMG